MDVQKLSLFLDDDSTYQDVTKEVLLTKLYEVFEKFKASGDSILTPSSGICNSQECTNKGCKGYSFFGNVSNNYLSLVFEEQDGVISDIFQCFSMISTRSLSDTSCQLTYTIDTNEKASFAPDLNYFNLIHKCETALHELKEQYDNQLSKSDCFIWLSENKSLYNEIQLMILYGGVIRKLRRTFSSIERLLEYLDMESAALEAINEYNKINFEDEWQRLEWLAQYEDFGFGLELFLNETCFNNANDIIGTLIPLRHNTEVSLQRKDFSAICDFLLKFCPQYWGVMDRISTELEQNKSGSLNKPNEYYEPGISLKEYLMVRKQGL